jgi:branched-subunit amino acid aminotransferase/4-amino-4-deoxychorismate lyase
MAEPWVFINRRWLPAAAAGVPLDDAGFVLGTTVSEQLRTFGGKLFRLPEHLARLQQSLATVGVAPPLDQDELTAAAREIVARNHPLLEPQDDLGLSLFVTPGPYRPYAYGRRGEPLVCLHTYPLPFWLWAEKYQHGESLVVTEVTQVPASCWPRSLKCRSRMHYYLAERRAAAMEPGSRALLLDEDGFVTEAATANVLVYRRDEGLLSPPRRKILPGISLAATCELAARIGLPVEERDLTPADLATADELFLTSTPLCIVPVVRFGDQPVGLGVPGPVFHKLLAAWNALVGLDIVAQAQRFAARGG